MEAKDELLGKDSTVLVGYIGVKVTFFVRL